MRHATILVAILAFVPLTSATAQVRQPRVERGTRVRVTVPRPCTDPYTRCTGRESRRNVGTFLAWKADSLVMESEGDTLAVHQRLVRKLEVSTGRGPTGQNKARGFLLGALVGTSIGIGMAAATAPEEGCVAATLAPGGRRDKGGCLYNGGMLGFLVGSLLGLAAGAGVPGDLWEEVSLSRLRVSFGPQRDGRFGLGLSVRF